MSWYDYKALAARNPELLSDDSAHTCFEVYLNSDYATESPYRIPMVQEPMPKVVARNLNAVERRLSDTAVSLPSKLPMKPKGKPIKNMQIRWNRCPTSSMTYHGWIDVHGHDADIYVFAVEADLSAYREALTAAAILRDNSGDSQNFTVKVFAPDMYNEWKQCYQVKVCSGILRPLQLNGQAMWNITDDQFISFDGKNGGWYTPFIE